MSAGPLVGRLATAAVLMLALGLSTGCSIQVGSSGYGPYNPGQPGQQPVTTGGQTVQPVVQPFDPAAVGAVSSTPQVGTVATGTTAGTGTGFDPQFQPANPGPAAPETTQPVVRARVAPDATAVQTRTVAAAPLSADAVKELSTKIRWLSGGAVRQALQALQARAGTLNAQDFETARGDLLRQVDNALLSDYSGQIAAFKTKVASLDVNDPYARDLRSQADSLSSEALKRTLEEVRATLQAMRATGAPQPTGTGDAPNVDDLNMR